MKNPILYGFLIAVAGLLVSVVLTLTGMYGDPQKLGTAQLVSGLIGLVVAIVGLWLGISASRAVSTPSEGFSYGRAVGAGALIVLWDAIFGAIFTVLFFTVINPDVREVMVQANLDKIAAKGGSPERAEGMIRMMVSVPILTISTIIFVGLFGMLLTLIIAAFLRRDPPRSAQPPAEPVVAA